MAQKPITSITTNTLFYSDNLKVLKRMTDSLVDLVYLDPPFNSNRNYNVLFRDEGGKEAESQIMAFEDTWHWGDEARDTYNDLVTNGSERVSNVIGALHTMIGTNQMMAYLVMMAARLVELHRVLKPTGSLYLHCDTTASHYLKIILDAIFGFQNYRNEISWRRTGAHSDGAQGRKGLGRVRDIILFYSKTEAFTWNSKFLPYNDAYVKDSYRYIEPETGRRYRLDNLTGPGGAAKGNPSYEVMGITRYWRYSREKMNELIAAGRIIQTKPGTVPAYKRYLDEMPGVPLQDDWDDIKAIGAQDKERLGYPTQKPLDLLERIIELSSNPGEIVLDPFCGCGTAIAAAQKLGRKWVGIDITHLAIALQKYRLDSMFPGIKFDIDGEPPDLGAARYLALNDRYQFQWWALSLVKARPLGGQDSNSNVGKKGSDKGIDGIITFIDDGSGKPKRVIVQVKSGKVSSRDIRDLVGTIQREGAAIGLFITLENPTRDMLTEAASAGVYNSPGWQKNYPRLQILTVEDLMRGVEPKMPPAFGTFKQAQRVNQSGGTQGQLGFDLDD
jgi:DNA modification methylase